MARILVVDDAETDRELLKSLLGGSGHEVATAQDGEEALRLARAAPPQLVVTDILMPGMDGYRLCYEWMKDERLKHVPLVFYTATYTSPEDRDLGLRLGAARFIVKPVEARELLRQIEDVIAECREAGRAPRAARPTGELTFLRQHDVALVRKLEHKMEALEREVARRHEARMRRVMDGLGPHNFVGLLTPDGVVLEANASALAAAGLAREAVIGRRFEQTYWFSHSPRAQEKVAEAVRRAAAGHASRFDVEIRAAGDARLWIDFSVGPVRDDAGRVEYLVPSAVVIQERKEAETERLLAEARRARNALLGVLEDERQARLALAESEDRYRDLVENIQDLICTHDLEGRILFANRASAALLGYTPEELARMNLADILAPEVRAQFATYLETIRREGAASGFMRVVTKAGERRVWEYSNSLRTERSQEAIVRGMARDITERQRAEAELRERGERLELLSRRLVEVEETERHRINRELHDRVGPALAALGLNLSLIRSVLPPEVLQSVAERIDDTQKLIEETTAQLRNIMADLRPAGLDDYGLVAALRAYAAPIAARTGLSVTVTGDHIEPPLALGSETALFRIAQEALNNIVKHAQAYRAEINIEADSGRVKMTVADDGIGFNPSERRSRRHWGLRTMRERAEAIGASFRIDSASGRGTRIVVELARRPA